MTEMPPIPADIYRKNAFRILGLPSSARLREVKRRAAMLASLVESGDAEGVRDTVIGGLARTPDEAEIREASHRLESPQDRLIDEAFWFRAPAEDGPDLRRGQIGHRVWTWLEEEILGGADGVAATHNLAVFYHLVALQIEARLAAPDGGDTALRPPLQAEAGAAWREAMVRWAALEGSAGFRTWLKQRFDTVAAARLEEEAFEATLAGCCAAPLGHLVRLGFEHGRDGRLDEAARLRDTALANGVTDDAFTAAAAEMLREQADQLLQSIETGQADLTSTPGTAAQKARELMDRVLPEIDAMQALVGRDHHIPASVGDAVATAVNRAQIAISDKLKDHATSRDLLGRVHGYARSPELVPVLKENLAFLTCQYCQRNPHEDGKAHKFTICRITRPASGTGQYNYNQAVMEVPRCGDCAGAGRSDEARAVGYHAVRGRLEQGWLPRAEPTQADLADFLRKNG